MKPPPLTSLPQPAHSPRGLWSKGISGASPQHDEQGKILGDPRIWGGHAFVSVPAQVQLLQPVFGLSLFNSATF
jgi:hypothetical protein